MSHSQRGNALFLILIAVALFAALSFAVTQSSRSGGSNPSKEQGIVEAAKITQIGADLQSAALRMKLSGTAIDTITLHTVAGTGGPVASAVPCSSGATCLFGPDGGGATFIPLSTHVAKSGATEAFTNLFEIADNAKVDGIANNAPILLYMANGISEETCRNLNKGLGIDGIPQDLSFVAGTPIDAATGKEAACYQASDSPTLYTYYHVLAVP